MGVWLFRTISISSSNRAAYRLQEKLVQPINLPADIMYGSNNGINVEFDSSSSFVSSLSIRCNTH